MTVVKIDSFHVNLSMVRGDTESISVNVSGCDAKPDDYLEMTIRQKIGSTSVIHKKQFFTDGNSVTITFLPEETSVLAIGKYVYDIQITIGEMVKTIVKPSDFVLEPEVTYEE